ncbi:carbohydrate ABC transporter permease [Paenibacillaceae bacterium WGS1546]|uniref:carbohydrate ABC transporter permease n=1 Tax=Cohnella sp. WGS1546 TaxID=3366810 RepID=UPI00372CEE4D
MPSTRMTLMGKRKLAASRSFLYPLTVFLFITTIFPGVYSLWVSLTDLKIGTPGTGNFVGLSNYWRIFTENSLFVSSLGKTALFALIALPIQFAAGYAVAKVFAAADKLPGTVLLRTIYLLPVMITPLSVGLFWSYILNPMVGVLNHVLELFHLPSQAWLSEPGGALFTIIGIYLWQWTPFAAMLILAGLLSISPEIYESSQVDGARWWNRVFSIDLPLLRRVLGVTGILSLVQIIQTFDLILATTNGGPGTSTLVSGFAVYREAFKYFDSGKGAAESIVILALTLLLSQVFARYVLKEEPE